MTYVFDDIADNISATALKTIFVIVVSCVFIYYYNYP